MNNQHYDYIIAGAGLSGLSLAWHMLHTPLAKKRVLVIDKSLEPTNEKTWSFWHQGTPPFKKLIHKSWQQIKVIVDDDTTSESLHSYSYHSIRSGRFRKNLLDELHRHSSVDLLEAPIQSLQHRESATLATPDCSYTADYIFQSCLSPPALQEDQPRYPLIQHFVGWELTTGHPVFDASTVTLMDFDTGFNKGVAFVYILPWSSQEALIEYTIFSDSVEDRTFYRKKLELYLYNKFHLSPLDYKIKRTEYGRIPMQDHGYFPYYAKDIINMGTVGGLTKPSTGYTFSRIQRHAKAIIERLVDGKKPALPPRSPLRYRAYDLWLLQIIHDHPEEAVQIFHQLFNNNTMDEVFHFLSEKNTLAQDLRMMSKVSYPPFFRAMWKTKKRLLQLS